MRSTPLSVLASTFRCLYADEPQRIAPTLADSDASPSLSLTPGTLRRLLGRVGVWRPRQPAMERRQQLWPLLQHVVERPAGQEAEHVERHAEVVGVRAQALGADAARAALLAADLRLVAADGLGQVRLADGVHGPQDAHRARVVDGYHDGVFAPACGRLSSRTRRLFLTTGSPNTTSDGGILGITLARSHSKSVMPCSCMTTARILT